MFDVVLRVAGRGFDVDAFLRQFPSLHPDATWTQGQRRLRSRPPSEDSGFNIAIGEGATWDAAWSRTQTSLGKLRSVLEALTQLGASARVDIGILGQGPSGQGCQIALEPSDLALLERMGLTLLISVYPLEDEESRSPPTEPSPRTSE